MAYSVRIGCSGWNYKHWRGAFYPQDLPEREWFEYYCRHFNTVEINNTFYHQPTAKTFTAWHDQAPPGFRYAIKANRYITHMHKLHDVAGPVDNFLQGVGRLKSYVGPLLYQLPPHWHKNLQRLRQFAKLLPKRFTHVFEFRDRDWLADDTYALMKQYGLCLCVHDILPRHPRRVTGAAVYIRLHGAGQKYAGTYSRSRLKSWARWIEDVASEHDVYVFFNNDASAHAVRDAQTLQEMCG